MNNALPILVALTIFTADRLTKLAILQHFGSTDTVSVIPNLLRIVHVENAGAAFGVLAEGNPLLRVTVLIGISGLVLLYVIRALWGRDSSLRQPLARLALALILGGAVGNLYDRVLRGTVTDFIEVYYGQWSWPAFNVADSAISVGSVFLLIELMRPQRTRSHAQKMKVSS